MQIEESVIGGGGYDTFLDSSYSINLISLKMYDMKS